MKFTFPKTPFYFLRHAETDHNVNKIYDDFSEVHLNENGKKQALEVQRVFHSTPITTVCSSPLLRVQQTKAIVLGNKLVKNHIVLNDFRECSGALWRLFLTAETRDLSPQEWIPINEFTNRVKAGLEKVLQFDEPILLIAHGGTYWALAHLLQLEGDPKIGNCFPMYITPEKSGAWKAQPLLMN